MRCMLRYAIKHVEPLQARGHLSRARAPSLPAPARQRPLVIFPRVSVFLCAARNEVCTKERKKRTAKENERGGNVKIQGSI